MTTVSDQLNEWCRNLLGKQIADATKERDERMSTKRAFEERDRMLARGDSELFPKVELCFVCDEPTGRAGRDDDSIYSDNNEGPYCMGCWKAATKNNTTIDDVLEAAECVVATAFGNIDGLSDGEQLEALRLASRSLKTELESWKKRTKGGSDE